MKELLLADNQDITRIGLKSVSDSLHIFASIHNVNNKHTLITLLETFPDSLVIIDYTSFDFTSIEELLIVRSRFKDSNWILFSEEITDVILKQTVFNEEQISILLKSCSLDEISICISLTAKGNRYICNQISNHLLTYKPVLEEGDRLLTSTEKEILKEIALGHTTKEIAASRNLSVHTIVTHRKNIFRKLDVNNVYEATKYAIRAGIIDIADYYI